jgi:aromatic-L-amino-acid decarboxylase
VREAAEWIAEFLEHVGERRVAPRAAPGTLVDGLPRAAPEQGEEIGTILADFDRLIVPDLTQWNHPGFMAYFASTASGPGILGEMLAAAINTNGMFWRTSPGATELEQVVLAWLWQLMGLPGSCFGMIHDTASTSTLHAVVAAREALEDLEIRTRGQSGAPALVAYTSEQAHWSVEKAAITLGIGQENVRKIAVDNEFRMRPELLDAAIVADAAAGKRPFFVTATVGTTATTSIDPVPAIAGICRRRGLWLHVDAAYGGIAAIVPELRHVVDGCEQADSLVVNPHKWLFTPVDLSAFYCRRPEILRRAFSLAPQYLRGDEDPRAVDLAEYGVPLGRRFRALKLWFVLRYFGREGIIASLREHMRLTHEFAARVCQHPDFEMTAPMVLGVVCFRFRPPGVGEPELDRLNRRLLDAVNETGKVFLSGAVLKGRFSLHLAVGNLRTTHKHIEQVWEIVQSKSRELTL